jgi:hypothetical protein
MHPDSTDPDLPCPTSKASNDRNCQAARPGVARSGNRVTSDELVPRKADMVSLIDPVFTASVVAAGGNLGLICRSRSRRYRAGVWLRGLRGGFDPAPARKKARCGVKSLSHTNYPRRPFLRGLRGSQRGGRPYEAIHLQHPATARRAGESPACGFQRLLAGRISAGI